MADTGHSLSGSAALTETTIYTVPADTTFYVKSINITNTTDDSQAFTLLFGTIPIAHNLNIPKYGGAALDDTHVLAAASTIKLSASSTDVKYVISGVLET